MKYMGSKRRIAKEILPIILKNRKPDQWYVEPFVGGGNMIENVDGLRIGSDINKYLITLYKALQNGWLPPDHIDFELYKSIQDKKEQKYPLELIGYVGFSLSFGGKFFGGYARDVKNDYSIANEIKQSKAAKNSLLKQSSNLKDVDWYCLEYHNLHIPPNSIIYCDPPYAGTTKYKTNFDHDHFFKWTWHKATEGHEVFISEYNAPPEWECIWQKEINSSLTKDTGAKKGIEKLFVPL